MADIGFVLDASAGTGEKAFKTSIEFMLAVASGIGVGFDAAKIGLIVIGTETKLLFQLNKFSDIASLKTGADKITYPGAGARCTAGKALRLAKDALFPKSKRKEASKILVLLISGESTDDVTSPAAELKAAGVTSLVIGMGQSVSQPQVDSISSSSDYQLTNVEYATLLTITPVVVDKIKNGEVHK